MAPPTYTLVVGVDERHLQELAIVWPTWMKHKPFLRQVPLIVFYDWSQLTNRDVEAVVGSNMSNTTLVPWPALRLALQWRQVDYTSQRDKMLSGFVHVAAEYVDTPYWLKLDTDVVATAPERDAGFWSVGPPTKPAPAIIAHRWGYTKPADQMLVLDQWVETHKEQLPELAIHPPLDLKPVRDTHTGREGVLGHSRIISWCGFFHTRFTQQCAEFASRTVGPCRIPVPSQDGYMFYCAERLRREVVRLNMKVYGWQHWGTRANLVKHAALALGV